MGDLGLNRTWALFFGDLLGRDNERVFIYSKQAIHAGLALGRSSLLRDTVWKEVVVEESLETS